MARKRPPGSKKRGPTSSGFDPFGMKQNEVLHRMRNLDPICFFAAEYEDEVTWATQEILGRAADTGELPENYSIMVTNGTMAGVEGPFSQLASFGLSEEVRVVVALELEEHPDFEKWRMWAVAGK